MKKFTKALITALLIAETSTICFASGTPAPNPSTGSIRGRIVDGERNILPGAVVYIDDKSTGVISDIDGNYSISGLNPGRHNITISYVGFAPITETIEIKAGGSISHDFKLRDNSTELKEVVVAGVFGAQKRAINVQKNNLNITNIVSSDQVGKFPDSNIGDALKRITGINVQYDQGEARFGQVRGTSADLSSVTINGSRLPSAEGDTRSVQLDLIPADMIQTIEVNKVVTPDQDGDAIGGSINLVTKNSPYRRTISAMAGSGYNWISRKMQLNLGFTYGDRYFNDKLGMILSASYQNAPSGSYDTEFVWEKDDNGNAYVNEYQIRRYYVTRERQSYSLSLDYKFNTDHSIYFKGIFNNRNDWENRYRTTLKDIEPEGKATVRVQTKGGSPDNRNARLERQRTMDFTFGGDHHLGNFNIDWKLGYDRASEERPNERYIDYQLKKQKFNIDYSNLREPFASPQDGYTMTLNDDFSLKELTEQQEDIVEEDFKFAINAEAPISQWAKIKFGGKIAKKTKKKEIDFYEYSPIDEDSFNSEAFSNTTNQNTSRFMPSAKYQAGTFIDKEYLGSINLNDAGKFEREQVQEELADNYKARETVTSGYVRFDSDLEKNLKLMAGLRVENTDLRYTGRIYDEEEELTTVSPTQSSNYINFLPSFLLKWDVNKNFTVRASYTETLARPKYSSIVPGMSISRSDNEIKIGNPDLEATTSHNFDLNAEYYFKSIGLVGAGIFFKKIEGFIVDEVAFNKEYQGQVWTKYTQPKNAGNADLLGVELSYQRDFGFICPALRCIGFYGTYTYSHSSVTDFNFEGRENEDGLRLPGTPEHTANASLYFEKSGISLRLSYNFASDFIDEMGAGAFYDRYYDKVNYLDCNASYTFGKKIKFTVFAEANNLLNQPLRYYQGSKDYTMQAEYYGVKVNGGFKINF